MFAQRVTPCSLAGGLECSPSGKPSPFAARKMRDRMLGNIYPFVPLNPEEMALAFELQLERRVRCLHRLGEWLGGQWLSGGRAGVWACGWVRGVGAPRPFPCMPPVAINIEYCYYCNQYIVTIALPCMPL